MTVNIGSMLRPASRARVIALHCSGANANQWCTLAEALGGGYEVATPEHYGCGNAGPWTGEHAFTLADEAARAITLIDNSEKKVHLVGHSYGGGVALHVALARPGRIASMALYEPSAFHLLREMGESGGEAYAEITGIARHICEGVVAGDYRGAVAAFVDYWNGPGAFDAMRPGVQNALIGWAPKAPLDFRALIDNPTPPDAYSSLDFPVLIMHGEHAPRPTRLTAEGLSELLPVARLLAVSGAGHMGPLTHAREVSALMVEHIGATEVSPQPPHWPSRSRAEILCAASQPVEGGMS